MKKDDLGTKYPITKKSDFKVREFEEVEDGYYDHGFYYTPNGSKIIIQ